MIMYTIKKGGMIMKLSNKRMSGFTLAEVLITLGIIGVVAAMTMPTLMNSTQGAQYKAAYKKALSAIAQQKSFVGYCSRGYIKRCFRWCKLR